MQTVSKISLSLNCSEFGKYSGKITPKSGANDGQFFTPFVTGSNQEKSATEFVLTPVRRLKANKGHSKIFLKMLVKRITALQLTM